MAGRERKNQLLGVEEIDVCKWYQDSRIEPRKEEISKRNMIEKRHNATHNPTDGTCTKCEKKYIRGEALRDHVCADYRLQAGRLFINNRRRQGRHGSFQA